MGRFDVHRYFNNDEGQPRPPDEGEGGSQMNLDGENFGEQIGEMSDGIDDSAREMKGQTEQKLDDMTD